MSHRFDDKIVLTRKKHVCYGCGRRFSSGTPMTQWRSVEDGQFFNAYNCADCSAFCESKEGREWLRGYDYGIEECYYSEYLEQNNLPKLPSILLK